MWSGAVLQILDRPIHDRPIDPALRIGESEEKAVIAHDVDEPWNPTRVFRDAAHRGVGKQRQVTRARDAQPGPDVVADLVRSQGGDLAAQPDPLLELLQLGELEPGLELRLPDQQDL